MRKRDGIDPTKHNGFLVAGVAFVALVGIVSPAQSGTMGNGAKQRNQVGVNKCLAMPHDQMMNDQACKTMMAVHPDLFPAGTVKPKSAPSH